MVGGGGPSETRALVGNSRTTRDHGTLPTPCCTCPGSQTTASAAIIPTVRLGQELPASPIFVPVFNLASTREESRMYPLPGPRDAPLLVACFQPPPSPSLACTPVSATRQWLSSLALSRSE